jgi:hypothetical protein
MKVSTKPEQDHKADCCSAQLYVDKAERYLVLVGQDFVTNMKLTKQEYKNIYRDYDTEEILSQLELIMHLPRQIDAAEEILSERGLSGKEIKRRRKKHALPTSTSRALRWITAPYRLLLWKTQVATFSDVVELVGTTKTGDQIFTDKEVVVVHEYLHRFKYSHGDRTFFQSYESQCTELFDASASKRVIYNPKTPEVSEFFPYVQLCGYLVVLGLLTYALASIGD